MGETLSYWDKEPSLFQFGVVSTSPKIPPVLTLVVSIEYPFASHSYSTRFYLLPYSLEVVVDSGIVVWNIQIVTGCEHV